MTGRRQFLSAAAVGLGLTPAVAWLSRPARMNTADRRDDFRVRRSDADWRATLTAEQYHVLREQGTERPFSSPLNTEKRHGIFACAGCGQHLFASATKYESGTGWPSFWAPLDAAVDTDVDRSWLMIRTEVHCARCGGHLGHLFDDGPKPSGLRYCMNGVAMRFEPA